MIVNEIIFNLNQINAKLTVEMLNVEVSKSLNHSKVKVTILENFSSPNREKSKPTLGQQKSLDQTNLLQTEQECGKVKC